MSDSRGEVLKRVLGDAAGDIETNLNPLFCYEQGRKVLDTGHALRTKSSLTANERDVLLLALIEAAAALHKDDEALHFLLELRKSRPEDTCLQRLIVANLPLTAEALKAKTEASEKDDTRSEANDISIKTLLEAYQDLTVQATDVSQPDLSYKRALINLLKRKPLSPASSVSSSETSKSSPPSSPADLAAAESALARYRGALEAYLEDFPADALAWREVANLYIRTNELDLARSALEQVIACGDSFGHNSWLLLADVCFARGHTVAALKYAGLVVAYEPNNERAVIVMLTAYAALSATAKESSPASPSPSPKSVDANSGQMKPEALQKVLEDFAEPVRLALDKVIAQYESRCVDIAMAKGQADPVKGDAISTERLMNEIVPRAKLRLFRKYRKEFELTRQ